MLVKKDKDKVTQEYWDKNKTKLYNSSRANTSQSQTQVFKNDKYHENRQRVYLAIRINATEVFKKDKDKNKTKNLSYIEYYTYK